MADEKLTDLQEITTLAADDWLYAVDKSDTTDDPAGSSRKITAGNAIAGPTGPEIKALYEVEANAFTDALFTKLGGVEDNADVTGAANVTAAGAAMLAGQAGGQTLNGSPTNGQDLDLQGNPGANPGFINANSPIIFGPYTGNPAAAYGFDYSVVDNPPGAFIGGGLNFSGTISMTNGTFIYESFRGSPSITTNANPGFSAYTVLQALPLLTAGTGAAHNPLNSLIINAGTTVQNGNIFEARTAATSYGLNFSPQTRANGGFATMSVTNQTAVNCRPTFSTVANSVVNLGTVRGLHQQDPGVALFQPALGTENMTANIGLDVDNISFGGNVTKAAVRSAQTAASNAYFLLQTGTAKSQLLGQLHFPADLTGVTFGDPATDTCGVGYTDTAGMFFAFTSGEQFRLSAGTGFNRFDPAGTADLRIGYDQVDVEGDFEHQGTLLGFYGTAAATQPTALTAQETDITHAAPGVADYAIQDLTDASPFGFATQDEGNTVLQVIANLQARVQELEDKLQSIGLLA